MAWQPGRYRLQTATGKTSVVEVGAVPPPWELGRVEVTAQVKLNGKDLGILWKTPFRLDITDTVKSGRNLLEIAVANLWPNRLIGDQSLPPNQRIAWTTWNPFTKDPPLPEAGLIGPVTLRCARSVTVRF